MIRVLVSMTFVFLFSSPGTHADDIKAPNAIAEFNYDIFIEGEKSGHLTMNISPITNDGYSISSNSVLELSGWWGEHSFKSNVTEHFSGDGVLKSADNMIWDGDKAYWIRMKTSGDELWASSVQVKNAAEHEDEAFVGVAVDIGMMFIPGAGEVLAISGLLLSEPGSSHENIRFPQNTYDTSLSNMGIFWWKNNKTLPENINILDVDILSIYQMRAGYHGIKDIKVGAHSIPTHYYELTPKKGKPLHMWFAVNQQNIPFIVQLTGEDSDGSFKVKMNTGISNASR